MAAGRAPDAAVVPVPAAASEAGRGPGRAAAGAKSLVWGGWAGASPGHCSGPETIGRSTGPGSGSRRLGPRPPAAGGGVVNDRGGTRGRTGAGSDASALAVPAVISSAMPIPTAKVPWRRPEVTGAGLEVTDPALTETTWRRLISMASNGSRSLPVRASTQPMAGSPVRAAGSFRADGSFRAARSLRATCSLKAAMASRKNRDRASRGRRCGPPGPPPFGRRDGWPDPPAPAGLPAHRFRH